MAPSPTPDENHKRNGLIARTVDWVFGYDFFLSYNHGDGLRLPRRIKERLDQAGFRVFLDQTEYVAGADLRRETRRQVVKSRKIVVVGRYGALKSEWVKREVEVALTEGKIPVILNVNNAVETAPADAALATMARERHWLRLNETLDDPDGEPTDHTISELVRGFKHTRQEIKRQRIFAAAAAVFAVAAGVAVWQAVEATRARTVAESQRDRAQRALDQVVATANRRVHALTVRVQAHAGIESTGSAAHIQPFDSSLDGANALIAQASAMLDKDESAIAHSKLTAAGEILASWSRTHTEDNQRQAALFSAYNNLAEVAAKSHDPAAAIVALTNSLSIAENLARTEHGVSHWHESTANTHQRLGDILVGQGNAEEAEKHYLVAIAMWRERTGEASTSIGAQRELAIALAQLGSLELSQSDVDAALARYKETQSILQQLAASHPSSDDLQRDLAVSFQQTADALLSKNEPEEAVVWIDRDLSIAERLAAANKSEPSLQRDLASSYDRRGHALELLGRDAEALDSYERSASLLQAVIASEETAPSWQRDAAAVLESTGKLLARTNRPDRAIQEFRRALALREGLAASFEEASWQKEVEAAYRRACELMLAIGRESEALETAEQYLLATSLSGGSDDNKAERIGRALGTLSWSALNARNFSRSVWAGRQAVELAPQLDWVRLNYAHALMLSGDRDAARRIYVAGMSLPPHEAEKWKTSIRKDFDTLTRRRLLDSLMLEIGALLGP